MAPPPGTEDRSPALVGRDRGPRDKVATTILVLATLVGVWIGVGAPSESPVAPTSSVAPAPGAVPTTGTAADAVAGVGGTGG